MAKKTDAAPGIKSALDLALERMQKKQGDLVPLTHEQKAAIAEIEADTKAKVAEEEIMAAGRIQAAASGGDAESARLLDEQIKAEIARIRERGERKKEKVRRGE
jgi:hypothetical protein